MNKTCETATVTATVRKGVGQRHLMDAMGGVSSLQTGRNQEFYVVDELDQTLTSFPYCFWWIPALLSCTDLQLTGIGCKPRRWQCCLETFISQSRQPDTNKVLLALSIGSSFPLLVRRCDHSILSCSGLELLTQLLPNHLNVAPLRIAEQQQTW
eukprot:5297846-Amphidinium_carterae.1